MDPRQVGAYDQENTYTGLQVGGMNDHRDKGQEKRVTIKTLIYRFFIFNTNGTPI
jgi:hypothetical protein